MEILFTKQFNREIGKLNDKKLAVKLESIIAKAKIVKHISELENVKKLTGFKNAYRIRMGDYRIGIVFQNDSITFAAFGHRKDIYKFFP